MSHLQQFSPLPLLPLLATEMQPEEAQWYAVVTRARHEKKVDAYLRGAGIATFLPLLTERHRWSDRRKAVQVPLFSCYTFVRLNYLSRARQTVLRAPGVIRFVGINGSGLPVPDKQIEDIRKILASNVSFEVSRVLKIGQRVRISGGCLDGTEGVLVSRNGDHSLVISVHPINRSLVIRIGEYKIEKI